VSTIGSFQGLISNVAGMDFLRERAGRKGRDGAGKSARVPSDHVWVRRIV
jgi:hypothetical protein